MISNALVWLSSRLTNFIAAGEGFAPIPAGDRSESLQEEEPGEYGKSQKSLLEKWKSLAYVFSESMFPLLNHRLSPEKCLGRIYSLDVFKGSPYSLRQVRLTPKTLSRREVEVWFEGLPATFQPTTRIKSSRNMAFDLKERDQASSRSFDEIWYTNGMVCYFGTAPRIRDISLGRKNCLFCFSDLSYNSTQK